MADEKVTRFEVIDHRGPATRFGYGRVFAVHDVKVELSYQDGGRTLKVFVNEGRADGYMGTDSPVGTDG